MADASARRGHGKGSVFQPKGRNTWRAQIRYRDPVTGKSRMRTMTAPTQEAAQELLDAELGKSPSQHAAERDAPVNVRQLMQVWLSAKSPDNPAANPTDVVLPHTWADYESITFHQILPRLGNVRLENLTRARCEQFMQAVQTEVSPHTGKRLSHYRARNVHRTLSQALRWAMGHGWIAGNPMTLVPVPSARTEQYQAGAQVETTAQEKALTPEQAVRVIKYLEETYPDTSYPLRWLLALTYGWRQAEGLGITWDHIDLQARKIVIAQQLERIPYKHGCGEGDAKGKPISRGVYPCSIQARRETGDATIKITAGRCPQRVEGSGGLFIRQQTKTYRQRTNTITPEIVERLRALHASQPKPSLSVKEKSALTVERAKIVYSAQYADLVFRDARGKPIDPSRDWNMWQEALDACGIPRRTVHAARHTAASHLVYSGAPLVTIQHLLGWSTPALVSRYTSRDQGQEDAIAALEEYRQRMTGGGQA